MENERMKKALELLSQSLELFEMAEKEYGEKFVNLVNFDFILNKYVVVPFKHIKEVEEVAGKFKKEDTNIGFDMFTTEFNGMTILSYKGEENVEV